MLIVEKHLFLLKRRELLKKRLKANDQPGPVLVVVRMKLTLSLGASQWAEWERQWLAP